MRSASSSGPIQLAWHARPAARPSAAWPTLDLRQQHEPYDSQATTWPVKELIERGQCQTEIGRSCQHLTSAGETVNYYTPVYGLLLGSVKRGLPRPN